MCREPRPAFIFGNYDYYDKSLPLADQGRIEEVDLTAADPAADGGNRGGHR